MNIYFVLCIYIFNFKFIKSEFSICTSLIPEKYVNVTLQDSDAPVSFVARCRYDWSYCIVKLHSSSEENDFQSIYISAEYKDAKSDEPKLIGKFKNIYSGKGHFHLRENFVCESNNREKNLDKRRINDLYNPIGIHVDETDHKIANIDVSWRKVWQNYDIVYEPVVFRATIVKDENTIWKNVTAISKRLYEQL